MLTRKQQNSMRIKHITAIALFCALAYVCMLYIKIPVQFLTLDVKDSLIVLCSLIFGPVAGLAIAVTVPFLELITISGTGIYGFIMNVLSSVVFSMTAGLIYRYRKTMTGAIAGLVAAVFSVTAVMVLANLLITPYYLGASPKDVAAIIPTLLLPFNLIKATLNAAIVLLLYKPLSKILKRFGFVQGTAPRGEGAEGVTKNPVRSSLVTIVAVLIIAASLCVIFLVLKK